MNKIMIDDTYQKYATDKQWEAYLAYCKYGSYTEAAELLKVNRSTVTRHIQAMKKRASRAGYSPEHDMYKEASPSHMVKGTSTLYDENGDVKLQWVKTSLDSDKEDAIMAFAKEFVKDLSTSIEPIPAPDIDFKDDLLTSYIIGDQHLGMRAWKEETGQDHDTDIAIKDLQCAIDLLVDGSQSSRIGLLVNVGDFFHANDTTSVTPQSKHLLDTDGRFSHTVKAAKFIIRYMIQRMLDIHDEVHVINARGNHDPDAGMWLNEILETAYEKEPRVTIIPNQSKIVKYQFGSNLIGVHHGDKVKRQNLYNAITRDWSKDIGECNHVYFWTGHIHHKQAEEIGKCLFESFNTLTPRDYWHSAMGYGAAQQMESITIHAEYGIIGRRLAPISQVRA